MYTYKAKECSCWIDYPNKMHKNKNGQWKCVDCYECIQQHEGRKKKTKCRLKTEAEKKPVTDVT